MEVINADDKRQITALLSVCASGSLLPMQLIYRGKTMRCFPSANVVLALQSWGHRFSKNPKNHWSSEETMKEFVVAVLKPYYDKIIKQYSLCSGAKLLWLIDAWSVHKKQEFRDWMKSKHGDWLAFIYVPANCTATCQPCDVILNRPFKAAFRQCFQKWLIQISEQKYQCNDETPIALTTSIVRDNSAR